MSLSIRAAARTAVPAAVLLLAGCGTGAGADQAAAGSSAADAVARAVEKTEGVTSLHYKVTGRFPERGRIADEGTVRTKPLTAGLTTANLSGEEQGETELRLVDGVLYGSAPGDMVEKMGGRHWISYGPAADLTTDSGLRMDVGALRDSVGRNPAREAAFLAGAPDVRRVGEEKIDGAGTTHYTGTAAVDELRASIEDVEDKTTRAGRDRSLDQYEKAGVDELTLDVWVDGHDRVRRLRTQGFGRHGELDLTVTFLDYGKPVTIRAPRPEDTADLRKPLEKKGS
ncbi:LppX_LprAFG lipoprotein [Streptomyces coerulescens]|uniref:LppX_LprAFG lipoprotein n=1 Tax=Streptomyces coerulescens TaxID=29304 RepID=A0ABW0CJZ4_STRCD